ncbi:MAG: hypothetical protein LBI08_03090, partial [Methanomassiliicoccaceae archaeon]|nr:hypothetical protein [Methanomassiliicoccaceae archaeon]
MDLSSTYKDRPVLIWVAIGIVVAVAVWLVIQGYMISTSDIDASSLTEITDEMVNAAKTVLMGIYVLLGILTLAIAYLLYRGARGGRTVLVFITAISIVFNAYGMV